jgi:uncharacterized protein YdeI (YjbR/CyaY-like superfamily)
VKQDGAVTTPSDLPVHRFADQAAFEAWLEAEHERAPGVYVVLAKKGAPEPTLKQSEMVESLLCFGWIDGRANRLDDHHFTVRVTPRRSKSIWSKKNVDWVQRLIEAGRMRPAGLAAVEAAQADGRWDRAYAGSASITVPDDLAAALAEQPSAREFFEQLDGANRYAVLWRVHTATTPQTRAKRIAALVEMLAEGRRIH